MKKFFSPSSICVIGASRNPEKIGYIIFENLVNYFEGKVFGVNPSAQEILGQKIYRSVLEIKEKIDVAVICIPADLVPQALEECGKKGILYAIIISAGFSESGRSGTEREKKLLEIAQKFGIRILGPNCLGLINNLKNLNASFAPSQLPPKRKVAIFSQSGAMGAAILDFACGENFGFSYFVSLGNKADISEIDLLEAWEKDSEIDLAVGYLEDIKDGQKFLEVAKKFSLKKPLILLKGGMSKAGNRAAASHTAAMAQDIEVFKTACFESGVVLAKNLSDMFELAVAFSENPIPQSKGLAIITNAGGPAVLAADACESEGVELPHPGQKTIQVIYQNTLAASIKNPIDLRGDARPSDYRITLEAVLKDKNFSGVLLIISPQRMTEVNKIAEEISKVKKKAKKPIYVNFLGGKMVAEARKICRENQIPSFTYPERGVRAFRFQAERNAVVDFLKKERDEFREPHPNFEKVNQLLKVAFLGPSYPLISKILSLYNVPMAEVVLAKNENQAALALKKIKPPVVMKVCSKDILHKTDVGGVILGIKNKREARLAFRKIIENVKRNCPEASVEGVIVMEMASEGLELILGAKKDAVFGPVLMFGFGGIFVELIKDFSLALPPFSQEKIRQMILKTKASKIIYGYRGKNYNPEVLEKTLLGLARLIVEHPQIKSIEVNPAILMDKNNQILGLDAKLEFEKDNQQKLC